MITVVGDAQVPRGQVEVVTSPASEHYSAALRFGSAGDLSRARRELDATLRADPTHTSARLRLAVLDDVREAMIPVATAVHLFKAMHMVEVGRRAEARSEIDAAIQLSPRYHEAYRLRGRERIDIGDTPGAIADYTRSLELEPSNTNAYLNRAVAFLHAGDVQRSLADFAEAIRRRPPNLAEAYASRGGLYALYNAPLEALADFEKAIELDPGLPVPYFNKALIHEGANQIPQAIETLKALIRNARPGYARHIEQARAKLQELERR
jgi:tetratricopeptide (TPR) repeat protein